MKKKDGFISHEVGGQEIAVAVGERSKTFTGMIQLNKTGGYLWELLETDQTEDSLTAALVEKYNISEDTARQDVKAFVNKLREGGILDE